MTYGYPLDEVCYSIKYGMNVLAMILFDFVTSSTRVPLRTKTGPVLMLTDVKSPRTSARSLECNLHRTNRNSSEYTGRLLVSGSDVWVLSREL